MCREKSMELQFSWVWTEFPEQNSQLQGTSISFATLKFWKILEITVFNSQVMSVLRLSDMCHECLRIVHKKLRQRVRRKPFAQAATKKWSLATTLQHVFLCFFAIQKTIEKCVCPCYILLLAVYLSCRSFAWPQRALQPLIPWLFALHVTCSTIIIHHLPSMSILCLYACVPMCSVVPESLSNLSRTFQAEGFDHTWLRLRSASVVVGLHPDEALTPTMIDSTTCNWLLKPIELECDWGIHTILKHYQHFRTFYTTFEHFATFYTILQPHLSGIIVAGRI